MPQLMLTGIVVEELRPAVEREIVPLDFEGDPIRAIFCKGEGWFSPTDVCRIAGIKNAADAISRLDEDEKRDDLVSNDVTGRRQKMWFISESGLYSLLLTTRLRKNHPQYEKVKRFRRWVTHDVLPSVRRTGSYSPPARVQRARKMAKKLKSDLATAQIRCDVVDINKHSNTRLASEGAGPRDFALWHNGRYKGFYGQKAKDLRGRLGLKDYQTPLDRMQGLALSQSHHAVFLAEKKIAEKIVDSGKPLPFDNQAEILEETARDIAAADFEKLGTGYVYGLVEDRQRGLVIDVIRAQLPQ